MTTATVRGTGTIECPPDRAVVRIEMRDASRDAKAVAESFSRDFQRIDGVLEALDGIEVVHRPVTYVHALEKTEPGAAVSLNFARSWTCYCDDRKALALLLAQIRKTPAVCTSPVRWVIDDEQAALRQARAAAVADARRRADDYAAALGMRVFAATHVAALTSPEAAPEIDWSIASAAASAMDLNPPEFITISDTVEVSFRLVSAGTSAT